MFFSLLISLIEGLSAFFKLKAESLASDLVEKSEKRQADLIKQIEIERNKRTEESAQQADFLRSRLDYEKAKYEKLLANI
jgi:hypothetical protein